MTGLDTIAFNIPGAAAGPRTINVGATGLGALPMITDAVIIDGYTQPGSSPNTLAVGDDAVVNIVLNGGAGGAANGLVLASSGSTVRGLAIHSFLDPSGSAGTGWGIIVNGSNNTISGNFIGSDQTGSTDLGNRRDGIEFRGSNSGNVIGGTRPADRNIILGNGEDGIDFDQADNSANSALGNYIGTDRTGTLNRGNDQAGIRIRAFEAATIQGNLISGNVGEGIIFQGGRATVMGNLIGTGANGVAALGNGGAGISVNTGGNNILGGTAANAGNTIAFNGGAGIFVASATTGPSAIRGNSIFSNSGLGIDLQGGSENAARVTANDLGDGDVGANGLQNFPVITSATRNNIVGTLNSAANATYDLDFYASTTADPSGFGEGQMLPRNHQRHHQRQRRRFLQFQPRHHSATSRLVRLQYRDAAEHDRPQLGV